MHYTIPGGCNDYVQNIPIDDLIELQEYRKIGTVEELKTAQKYIDLAKKHDTIGNVIESCAEYESIGTVEECREAVKKTKPMEVTDIHVDEYYCPNCGSENMCDQGVIGDKYCPNCGQRLESEE